MMLSIISFERSFILDWVGVEHRAILVHARLESFGRAIVGLGLGEIVVA